MAGENGWSVTVRGVRGGMPRTGERFRRYGGNTSCVELRRGGESVFLDAGTGLAEAEPAGDVCILLSHVHLDHVLGLLGLRALGDPGRRVVLGGAPGLREALGRVIGPPGWPLRAEEYPARVEFLEIRPGEPVRLRDWLTVTAMESRHPGGSLIYKLEGDGRSLIYTPDCEPDGELRDALAAFAGGTDLLIWDANFTAADLRPGWGHSTWEQGIELGELCGARRVLMTHYSQDYDDGFLARQEELCWGRCIFAREGTVIGLD